MSSNSRRACANVILILLTASCVLAAVPRLISYQGRLDGGGDGPVDLTVRFYDSEFGGNLLFEETHVGVPRSQGLFTIQIGSETAGGVPNAALNAPGVWLAMAVNGGAELTPRTQLIMVPYAAKAEAAEGLVVPGTFDEAVHVGADAHVGVGATASPSARLHVGAVLGADLWDTVNVRASSTPLTEDGTLYLDSLIAEFKNVPIAAGVRDDGYRVGLRAETYCNAATFEGTLATQYGLWSRVGTYGSATGTVERAVAARLETLDSGGPILDSYGVYQTGADTKNYFEGAIGIGDTTPDATLDVVGDVAVGSRLAMTPTTFGYSSGWKVLVLGSAGTEYTQDAVTLSLGYDPSNNPSGSFIGDGREILVRNHMRFVQPSETDDGFLRTLTLHNGNVGIGTTSPGEELTVGGDGTAATRVHIFTPGANDPNAAADFVDLSFGIGPHHVHNTQLGIIRATAESDAPEPLEGSLAFYVNGGPNMSRAMTITSASMVGIGTSAPSSMLEVAGTVTANAFVGDGSGLTNLPVTGGLWSENGDDIYYTAGKVGIGTSTPATQFEVAGTGRFTVLEVNGGADLAEPFPVTPDADAPAIEPGMVMVIDPENAGQLRPATTAYDCKVAGVISGAKDLPPGMIMQAQQHDLARGNHPVALTGRVWCWCDANVGGAIRPGDMLTTSETPGHAMRATDRERAFGSVIGKAMTSLESGRGLVLVLVSLQ